MSKTIEQELLPCPFCGGKAEHQRTFNKTASVECQSCYASTFMAHNSFKDAAIFWNKRKPPVVEAPIKTIEQEVSQQIRIDIADLNQGVIKMFASSDADNKYAQDCLKINIAERLARLGYRKAPVVEAGEGVKLSHQMAKHIQYWWGNPNFDLEQYLETILKQKGLL